MKPKGLNRKEGRCESGYQFTICWSCRSDPLLIQVIEEMGKKSFGSYATLTIIEIPDDVDFVIEEYGGNEHIAEAHRTWG